MPSSSCTSSFMRAAMEEAYAAQMRGEVPIGAVIVCENSIIARAGNQTRSDNDPTAHAEIVALRIAAKSLGKDRLTHCDLYVTLEPCTMCAGAISHARIRRLYYAAQDEKGGAVESGIDFFGSKTCHHAPEVYSGIGEREAADLLRSFFEDKRS